MPLRPHLLARTAPDPPPARTGALPRDLAALTAHAARTRWILADADLDTVAWQHGRGPSGLRIGLAFTDGDRVWCPDPAPGEVSSTTGLDLRDVAAWALAIVALDTTGGPQAVAVQDERFRLRPTGDRVELWLIDLDGTVLDRLILPQTALVDGVRRVAAQAAALAERVDDPLPGLDRLLSVTAGL